MNLMAELALCRVPCGGRVGCVRILASLENTRALGHSGGVASTGAPVSVLDRESILELLEAPSPLVDDYLDLESQLQPHGFDLTLRQVLEFTSAGKLKPGNQPAEIPQTRALCFDSDGCVHLPSGAYMITLNEILNLPLGVMALARPRSSLLRSGVAIHTAVWEAGYRGRSQALLTVYNSLGWRLTRNARLLQMVFMYLTTPVAEGYKGRFLGENI